MCVSVNYDFVSRGDKKRTTIGRAEEQGGAGDVMGPGLGTHIHLDSPPRTHLYAHRHSLEGRGGEYLKPQPIPANQPFDQPMRRRGLRARPMGGEQRFERGLSRYSLQSVE